MSLRCLHLNYGDEFERFLRKNSQKCHSTDWPTPNGSGS
jgi:hypothetical protein